MNKQGFTKIEVKDVEDDGTLDTDIRQALNDLKAEPRVYSLIRDEFKLKQSEVKASMVPFLNLLEDLHYCDHCPGLDRCEKATPHYQIGLVKEGSVIRTNFHLCKLAREKKTYTDAFIVHDFPMEWWQKSLWKDVDNTEKKQSAKTQAFNMMTGASQDWLYLRGRRRSGRSFLAACLANGFAQQGKRVAFADTAKLVETLKDMAFNRDRKSEFERMMKDLQECDLLVLDDFGNENHTQTIYSTILFPLLNERAKNNRLMAFTSDFGFEMISDMYSEAIGKAKGTQLKYLLKDFCKKPYDVTSLDIH